MTDPTKIGFLEDIVGVNFASGRWAIAAVAWGTSLGDPSGGLISTPTQQGPTAFFPITPTVGFYGGPASLHTTYPLNSKQHLDHQLFSGATSITGWGITALVSGTQVVNLWIKLPSKISSFDVKIDLGIMPGGVAAGGSTTGLFTVDKKIIKSGSQVPMINPVFGPLDGFPPITGFKTEPNGGANSAAKSNTFHVSQALAVTKT